MALAEPYRSAVLYRYMDGLDSNRIAQRMGVSPATARKRVSRGVESLRREMECERRDVRAGLLALLAEPSAATAGVDFAGVTLAMGMLTKVTLAGVAAGLGFWLWTVASSESTVPAAAVAASTPSAQTSQLDVPAPDGPRERAAAPSPGGAAPAALASSAAVPRAGFSARGRIRGPRGGEVPEARLELLGASTESAAPVASSIGQEFAIECAAADIEACLEASRQAFEREYSFTPTREDWLTFVASAPGFTRVTLYEAVPEGGVLQLGTIELEPIGAVTGTVVDRSGWPVEGATVCAVVPTLSSSNRLSMSLWGPGYQKRVRSAETDARGAFTFGNLPAGLWRVWAGDGEHLWNHSEAFRLAQQDEAPELRLVLQELPFENRLAGRVVRPDGTPASGARIEVVDVNDEDPMAIPVGECDEAGAFGVTVEAGTLWDVRALDLGGERVSVTAKRVPAGTLDLVMRLAEPVWLDVAVHTSGAPLASFDLRVARDGERFPFLYKRVRDAAGGRVRVAVPDTPFVVAVTQEGYAPFEAGPFAPGADLGELTVELEKLATVRGLVTAAGEPLGGAIVQLVEVANLRQVSFIQGFPARLDGFNLVGVYSADDGSFELPITEPAEYSLFAEHDGWAAVELGPLSLDPARDEMLDVSLTAGGAIEGTVRVEEDEDPSGVTVRASRGDMRVHTTRTDSQGRYRIEHLTPGPWMVQARRVRTGMAVGAFSSAVETRDLDEDYVFPWDCQVAEGQTSYVDLDLSEQDTGVLEGAVRVDGLAFGDASVRLHSARERWSYELHESSLESLDADGTFRFGEMDIGDYWLVLTSGGAALGPWQWIERIEIERGGNEHTLQFERASLDLRGEVGEQPRALVVRCPGGVALLDPSLAPAGAFPLPLVGAGRLELVERGAGTSSSDPLQWPVVHTIEVAPAGSYVLELGD